MEFELHSIDFPECGERAFEETAHAVMDSEMARTEFLEVKLNERENSDLL